MFGLQTTIISGRWAERLYLVMKFALFYINMSCLSETPVEEAEVKRIMHGNGSDLQSFNM